jgi:DNA-binding winged helix-turn-helix (wHTH) protein/tetratricopeptide (TPR) repeat protein
MNTQPQMSFGEFRLDPSSRELTGPRGTLTLQDKTYSVLVTLLQQPGAVVRRESLYDALWPRDVHVEREAGLNTAVRKLRAALRSTGGDDVELIETLPRLGYRLANDLATTAARGGDPAAEAAPGQVARDGVGSAPYTSPSWGRRLGLAAAGATVIAAVVLSFQGRTEPNVDIAALMPDVRASYVEARALLGSSGDLGRAAALLEEVTTVAPGFAPGHAYRAEVLGMQALATADPTVVATAREAAQVALSLDPESFVAERALGMIELHFDWNAEQASERLQRAVQLGPDDPINFVALASLDSIEGRHDLAVSRARRAIALAPETMTVRSDAGYFLLRAGRYAEAATECAMVLRLDPDNPFGHGCLLRAHAEQGDPEAARPHAIHLARSEQAPPATVAAIETAADPLLAYQAWSLSQMLRLTPPPFVAVAAAYMDLRDPDAAVTWLERAAQARAADFIYVREDPRFAPLRNRSEFQALRRPGGSRPSA